MSDFLLPAKRNWSDPVLDHLSGAGLFRFDLEFGELVAECRGRMCYLATPYSKLAVDDDGAWCQAGSLECALRAARVARDLAAHGVTAVSPIVQAVEMIHADFINPVLDPLDDAFWSNWCAPLLRASDVVIVPCLEGWDESDGVWAEVRAALNSSRRVFLMMGFSGCLGGS